MATWHVPTLVLSSCELCVSMISQVQGVHDFLSPCDMWLYVCICVWLVLLVTLKACNSQMHYVELWHCHELLFCESVFGGFVLQ